MTDVAIDEFMGKFQFDPAKSLFVGVERECFLRRNGKIAPIAPEVLSYLRANNNGRGNCYGYELSACQLEDRTEMPCGIEGVRGLFQRNEQDITKAEQDLGFSRIFCGTGPEDMPTDHYPVERYDRIVAQMPREALLAACRVTGVHVHVGMPDHQTALRVYNQVVRFFPMLCQLGCVYFDGRLENYQMVVDQMSGIPVKQSQRINLFLKHLTNGVNCPPEYKNWRRFYERAVREGFVFDPRRLWDFIRISVHGTVEFRMFDSTNDLNLMVFWASLCQSLCKIAIAV